MRKMIQFRTTMLVLLVSSGAQAQAQTLAPIEDRSPPTLQQGQYRTGIAYGELERARHEAKLAEQDVLNARDANSAAQQQAAVRKRELDAAQKVLTAAQARLAAAQLAYEKEVNAVDAAHRAAPAAKPK